MTRPDPHASYREHVSSEAEAVEEDVRCRHDVSEDCPACAEEEIASLRAQSVKARKALEEVEKQCNEMRSLKGWRMNLIRENLAKALAALNSGEQKQIEDWPYPEGNPTCAQDLK